MVVVKFAFEEMSRSAVFNGAVKNNIVAVFGFKNSGLDILKILYFLFIGRISAEKVLYWDGVE